MPDQDYNARLKDYRQQVTNLFVDTAATGTVTRGANPNVSADELAARTKNLAAASLSLAQIPIARIGSAQNELAEWQLLGQIEVDLRMITNLLHAVDDFEQQAGNGGAGTVVRSGGGPVAKEILERLSSLEVSANTDAIPTVVTRGKSVTASKNLELAGKQLSRLVNEGLDTICDKTSEVGEKSASLLLGLGDSYIKKSLALVGDIVGQFAPEFLQSVSGPVVALAKEVVHYFEQIFDRVLALLGPDLAKPVREWVDNWLEEMGKGAVRHVAKELVAKLYATDQIEHQIQEWLKSAAAMSPTQIDALSTLIDEVSTSYSSQMGLVSNTLMVLGWINKTPFTKTPIGKILLSGVLLTLLGYTIFNGYDHCGNVGPLSKLGFVPDRINGIRETAEKVFTVKA